MFLMCIFISEVIAGHLLLRFPGYVLVAALNLTNVAQKSKGIDE